MSSRITTQWRPTLTSVVMLMMLAMLGTGVSYAADNADHDRARQAVEAGDVLPLRTILDRAAAVHRRQRVGIGRRAE